METINLSDEALVLIDNGQIIIKNTKQESQIILTQSELDILLPLIKRKVQMSICSNDMQFKGWCVISKYDDGWLKIMMENNWNLTTSVYLNDKEIEALAHEYLKICILYKESFVKSENELVNLLNKIELS
jgi:hypothetical protein